MQEIPSRTYNDDVMFICKIRGVEAIEKEYGKLKNYDVVLTDERKNHILERRGKKDFDIIMKYLKITLLDYDYILDDSRRNKKGIIYIKCINDEYFCAIFVALSLNNSEYANSHITGIVMNSKSFVKYVATRKVIDKKCHLKYNIIDL